MRKLQQLPAQQAGSFSEDPVESNKHTSMKTISYTSTASAPGTVANQPGFDQGGFPVLVHEHIIGEAPTWETLSDQVTLEAIVTADDRGHELLCEILIENVVPELNQEEHSPLPIDAEEHTAGRVVLSVLHHVEHHLKALGITELKLHLRVTKGLSVRGTGLGSSGASPAAAMAALLKVLKKIGVSSDTISDLHKAQFLQHADFGVPDNAAPAYFGNLNVFELDQENKVSAIERIEPPHEMLYVLVTPSGFGIETKKAREVLQGIQAPPENEELTKNAIDLLRSGEQERYAHHMENIHRWFVGGKENENGQRSRRSSLYPGQGQLYSAVEHAAKNAGAWGVTISGAGPTMLAFVPNKSTGLQVGQAMHRAFQEGGYDAVARLCSISPVGATIH